MSDQHLKRILLGDGEKYKAELPTFVGWRDPNHHIWELEPLAKWMADHLRQDEDTVPVSPAFKWSFEQFLRRWEKGRSKYKIPTEDYIKRHTNLSRHQASALCSKHAVEFVEQLASYQDMFCRGGSLEFTEVIGVFAWQLGQYLSQPLVLYVETNGLFVGNDLDCGRLIPPAMLITVQLQDHYDGEIIQRFLDLMVP